MTAVIDLAGRVALVTGAGGGIGRAIVERLAEAGANVIATDLKSALPQARLTGPASAQWHALDVTSPDDWDRMASTVAERYGALDMLVHNAGKVLVRPIDDIAPEVWRGLFAVNVDSMYLGTRAMLPHLRLGAKRQAAGASVVMMSSVAGLGGAPRMTAYCATKGAIRVFSRACAMEFAPDRIRVNSVHPGGVDTPMIAEIGDALVSQGAAPNAETALAGYAARHPLGRLVTPDEVARGVRYLLSDEAGFVTGTELVIDGGMVG